jgi:hypothetical protein
MKNARLWWHGNERHIPNARKPGRKFTERLRII